MLAKCSARSRSRSISAAGDTDLTAEGVGDFRSRSTMVLSHPPRRHHPRISALLEAEAENCWRLLAADVAYDAASALFLVAAPTGDGQFRSRGTHHIAQTGSSPSSSSHRLDDSTFPTAFMPPRSRSIPKRAGSNGAPIMRWTNGEPDRPPRLIEAQLHGGITQGFGQALWRHSVSRERAGTLCQAPSWLRIAACRRPLLFRYRRDCHSSPAMRSAVKGVE